MKKPIHYSIALLLMAFQLSTVNCQLSTAQNVSVSPSRFYYKAAPGETKKQVLHVTNSSPNRQSFNISFADFASPGTSGKTVMLKPGESEHSCSSYLSASPSFFELDAGKSQDVQVVIDMPNAPESNKVKWGTLIIKLTKERTEANSVDKDGVGMGLLETFQFVVHIFQTPPNVTLKQAEITIFKEVTQPTDTVRTLSLITENTGEAILDCATYLQFSNTKTGFENRTKPSAFTVLPEGAREMKFSIPKELPKGRYTVTAVVDFGSKEAVQAAEMDLEIK